MWIFVCFVARSRLKWLNSPVKATEYKVERELDDSEPAVIKDMKPEKDNKDDEVTANCMCMWVALECCFYVHVWRVQTINGCTCLLASPAHFVCPVHILVLDLLA